MRKLLQPILLILSLVVVFVLGLLCARYVHIPGLSSHSKFDQVLGLIEDYYVDSVQMDSLTDEALPLVLAQLDPHSVYLTADANRRESEGLDGAFYGIGIQFNTLIDTVVVTRVIPGGPSERAGLQPGDRIVRADTTSLCGEGITNDKILQTLKGPENSVVSLSIRRDGKEQEARVVRGVVPVNSIDAAYMVAPGMLYVRLNKWGAITYREFLAELARYKKTEIKGLIIDLRGNGGGYLEAATSLASEFLSAGQSIVYTQGRKSKREEYITRSEGYLQHMPLTILVNEGSASASEIFAGVMQDHDRALVIGRRTFGKGLVQRPFVLPDSSVVRLTIARYYTPSGRYIQRSYADGAERYQSDLIDRVEHGELYNQDSIASPADTTRYYTDAGRVVYGGGGIRPDVFVPLDSVGINSYYLRLIESGTLPRFAFEYVDKHRAELARYTTANSLISYLNSQGQGILYDYAHYAMQQGIGMRTSLLQQSAPLLLRLLRAQIADLASPDRNAYYQILLEDDQEVQRAVRALEDGSWDPLKKD